MSASSKKKLRNEQQAAKMTERQLTEQKEAKKLKLQTTAFVVVLAIIVAVAAITGVSRFISNSGIREKNTVAVTVGDHEISNAELNFYFVDAINSFANNYGSYAALFGLDLSAPLNEQVTNEETGDTWADDFLQQAKDSAAAMYALCDAAEAAGFTLSEDQLAQVDSVIANMQMYAVIYGYSNVDDYLKAIYGNGASEESYRAYYVKNLLGETYYQVYSEGLTYDDAAIAAADQENPTAYNFYSYNYYNLNVSKFLTGGTTDEEGNVTYSDDKVAVAESAAKADAEALVNSGAATVEELDAAIAALEVNADVENAASTAVSNTAGSSVLSVAREWVTDPSRKVGDIALFENVTHNHTDGEEDDHSNDTINGYYVVMFTGLEKNEFALKNVRHILAAFEGGSYDSNTGVTTYSDEEKTAAKAKAEELLASWQAGEATEESFAALANEKSADGDGTTGGLYENVYPGQMVANFENWCYDESRKPGDTGIVESTYGYHVMYFVDNADITYREYMITNTLRSQDVSNWYTELVEAMEITDGDTKYIDKAITLQAS